MQQSTGARCTIPSCIDGALLYASASCGLVGIDPVHCAADHLCTPRISHHPCRRPPHPTFTDRLMAKVLLITKRAVACTSREHCSTRLTLQRVVTRPMQMLRLLRW